MLPFLLFAEPLREGPAARCDAFLKAHPAFVATLDLSANGKPVAKQTLRAVRGRRLRFDLKGGPFDYSVVSTESTYMELDRLERVYDARLSTGGFAVYASRLSSALSYLPAPLMGGAAGIFGSAPTTVEKVAGGEEIRATIQTPQGPVELRLLVDAEGKPARFVRTAGSRALTWRLTSFADSKPDLALFQLAAPLGYVPFALPELPNPLPVGGAAPLTGWRQGGRAVDLGATQRGKSRLLAVLGADCAPSRAVRPSLASLARSMPVFVIAPGEIVDPSGTLMKRLSPPGTPMFYLVGGDGKVKSLWFGFDPAKAAAWEAEVREAAK